MKKVVGAVVFFCAVVGLVLAYPPQAPSKGSSVADTLKQLEQDLGDATVAANFEKLNQILADDWESVGFSGKIYTKENFLDDLKSGKDKLESFEIGSMDVKVFGNVAAAHGSVTEKRSREGKDISGELGGWISSRSADTNE
ncbi:MAG TPA: nuclear transport factor 2 family protein [Candidatus Polarisedimenticolia bacterium]|nr:nuclear transport factor 2 family protein [Candidatus Polarisedimenticolia bacterium]